MRISRTGIIGAAMMATFSMLDSSSALAARAVPPRYLAQVINPDLNGGLSLPGGALLVYGSDATVLRSTDGLGWTHAETPGSSDLARLATNADGSVLIAVGQKAMLLRSTDAGLRWQAMRLPKVETDLRTVVHVPGSKVWLAAGTLGRILRSSDDGKTWSVVESQLQAEFLVLHHDAATGTVLIGGSDGLVGHSKDQGVSWQITAISMPDPVTPVSGFYRFGKLLLATSALGRFLVSEDGAQSWDLMQASTRAMFTDAAFDPLRSAIVMAGHNGDVLRSTDSGRTWEGSEVVVAGHKSYLSSLRFDVRSRSLLAIGQGGVVARSTDGGASWNQASSDLRSELRGFLEHAPSGRLIVFGAGGTVAHSADSGGHWTHSREPLAFNFREVLPAPQGRALVAVGRIGDLARSEDAGASWKQLRVRYPDMNTPPDLRVLQPAPSESVLIAAGPPGAILRSSGDAATWEVRHWTPVEAERAFTWMLVDRRRRLLVAVDARGEMQTSRDDGLSWEAHGQSEPSGTFPFWQGVTLERDGVFLIAGKQGRAARSTDARTWTPVDTGTRKDLYGSHADERTGVMFLMGAEGTLLRSTDLGTSWVAVPSGSDQELRRMWQDPRTGTLLCYGAHGTILRSEDEGRGWKPVASGVDGVLRKALAEPRSDHVLLVGGQGSLLRSGDAGRTWQKLDTHTTRHFTSITADPASGDLVLVGERIVRLVRQSSR